MLKVDGFWSEIGWTFLGIFGHVPPRDAYPKARAAAERAVALDGRLVEAHATLGHLMFVYEWDWKAAESALRRAIALDPDMVMFDEPFAGQDPIAMGVLVKLIKSLNRSVGVTSVIVSHDVPETASIADYIYVISGGKVIGHGTPQEVMHSDSPEVRQFMRGEPDGPVPFHFPARDYSEDLQHG